MRFFEIRSLEVARPVCYGSSLGSPYPRAELTETAYQHAEPACGSS